MESINCVVETPKGTGAKYTFDHRQGRVSVTKILPAGLVFPFDFGFIPGTRGEDGDPLDVVIISELPSFPGCAIDCRIIGIIKAMQTEKGGERMRNDRLVAIPEISVQYKEIKEIRQLPFDIIRQLEAFFQNYNAQAGKRFKPLQRANAKTAWSAIRRAREKTEPAYMVQLLLPIYDNEGKPLPRRLFRAVNKTMIRKFGGLTAYTQSPATGLWENERNNVKKDSIVVFEVMVPEIDRSFWKAYKRQLEKAFRQDEIVVRQLQTGLL